MAYNAKLLKAIRENGWYQKDFARIVGDDPSIVSRIITGQWNMDEGRKVRYARVLRKNVKELFGDV